MQRFNQLVEQSSLIRDLANLTRDGRFPWKHGLNVESPQDRFTSLSAQQGDLVLVVAREVRHGKVWFSLHISSENRTDPRNLTLRFTDDLHSQVYAHLSTLHQTASRCAAVEGDLELLAQVLRPAEPAVRLDQELKISP